MAADRRHAAVMSIIDRMPTSPYIMPPRKLGSNWLSCCTWLMMAAPRRRSVEDSLPMICGSADCTTGVSMASSTANTTCMMAMARMLNPDSAKNTVASSVTIPEMISSATIMARLLTRSAITPPNGLISMVGMTDMASTVAKVVDDAVSSSTHMDMANRSMVLPNKEMP